MSGKRKPSFNDKDSDVNVDNDVDVDVDNNNDVDDDSFEATDYVGTLSRCQCYKTF
jgi:hypothetical protein